MFKSLDKNLYYNFKKENFHDQRIQRYRKLLVALFRLGSLKGYANYGELAHYANILFPRDKKIPERGGSLSKIAGEALGLFSTISYSLQQCIISVLVTRKYGGKQGDGFQRLLELLGIHQFSEATHRHKALKLCFHFESRNPLIEEAKRYISCPQCNKNFVYIFHYGNGLRDSEFICSKCGTLFFIEEEQAREIAEELHRKSFADYKHGIIEPEPFVCKECNHQTVIDNSISPNGKYTCIWCGETYEKQCIECNQPFKSNQNPDEIVCSECFHEKISHEN